MKIPVIYNLRSLKQRPVSTLTTALDLDVGSDARISGTAGAITLRPRMHASGELLVESGGSTEVVACTPPGLGIQVPEVHRCLSEGLLESPVMPWSDQLDALTVKPGNETAAAAVK